ncbi:MAG: acetate kinase [Frankiales bacterium]|nr:acetate kinase [Frankiales bacterium]
MRVLVVNAGSSSLKLSVLDDDELVASTLTERWSGEDDAGPLQQLLDSTGPVDAVGHRVVHGGPRHLAAARVDDGLLAELAELTDLAPLHQARALGGLRATARLLLSVPAVACFDTSFHRTLPPAARTYALPARWNARWGLQRFGFHGLSHAHAARRAAELVGRSLADLRVVTCHLGAGASLCAVRDGRSVDTTMGFTPLAGLVMQTRPGDVDPGLLLWLLDHGLSTGELTDGLVHRSGLAGLSGTSGDLRDVLAAREDGDAAAGLAYDVLVHHLTGQVAAMAAACGGLDVLVLTGGMGEHAPVLRADLAGRLAFLGCRLDGAANDGAACDRDISAAGAAVRTLVVTAREDLEVAREVRQLLD